MKTFFDYNTYFVDESVRLIKFENAYKVYNDQGEQIGAVQQVMSPLMKVLTLLVNRAMLPFTLDVRDAQGAVEATLKRGLTFWLSKVSVFDGQGTLIASIQQKFSLLKPSLRILDASGNEIANISGDWKAWQFEIKGAAGDPIGAISKKWGGAAREFFTSADKYNITIDKEGLPREHKIAILSTAIAVDMLLKNRK